MNCRMNRSGRGNESSRCRTRSLVHYLWVALFLLGCTPTASVVETAPEIPVITDRLDRKFACDSPATRIVSLSPSTTELLFALDLDSRIVGATKHCNYPDAALAIPRMGGGTLESISIETIVAASPDLVLCKWDSHQPLVESLDRLQIPVLAIGAQSLDELFEETRWLGRVTGQEAEVDRFIMSMRKRRDDLVRQVASVKHDPPTRVFYEVWDDPLMTAGPDSFIDELLGLAGLQNIVAGTAVRYPRISSETVVRGDPELILAPTTHFENVDVDSIAQRPGWASITAVADGNIHLISGDEISRCGPRMLDALAEIIAAAYPEAKPE